MLIDTQLLMADGQGPFNTGTNASTNYIDHGVQIDWSRGEPLWWVIAVGTTVTGSGSTCDFQLQADDNTSFSSPTVVVSTGPLALAALTAGTILKFRVQPGFERYVRTAFVVAAANQTAGTFSSFLTRNVDDIPATPFPRATYPLA